MADAVLYDSYPQLCLLSSESLIALCESWGKIQASVQVQVDRLQAGDVWPLQGLHFYFSLEVLPQWMLSILTVPVQPQFLPSLF